MYLNKPVTSEFLLKINIYAYDKHELFVLQLHTKEKFHNKEHITLDYVDYIKKGEIIADKIYKVLKKDFGITKVLDLELIERPLDELDYDEEGSQTFEYILNIEVEKKDKYEKKLGDVFAKWIKIE